MTDGGSGRTACSHDRDAPRATPPLHRGRTGAPRLRAQRFVNHDGCILAVAQRLGRVNPALSQEGQHTRHGSSSPGTDRCVASRVQNSRRCSCKLPVCRRQPTREPGRRSSGPARTPGGVASTPVSVRNSYRGSHRGSAPQELVERSVSRAATHSPVLDGLGSGPVLPRAVSHNDRASANGAQGGFTQPPVRAMHMESMHTGQGPHLLTGHEGLQTDRALENRRNGRFVVRRRHKVRHHCVPLHAERDLKEPGRQGWGSFGGSRWWAWLCAHPDDGC